MTQKMNVNSPLITSVYLAPIYQEGKPAILVEVTSRGRLWESMYVFAAETYQDEKDVSGIILE